MSDGTSLGEVIWETMFFKNHKREPTARERAEFVQRMQKDVAQHRAAMTPEQRKLSDDFSIEAKAFIGKIFKDISASETGKKK